MKARYPDLLFRPDTFFREIAEDPEDLVPPLLIVLAGAAIAFATTVIRVYLSGRISDLVKAGVLVPCVLESFMLPLIGWILASAVMYGIATRGFSGSGTCRATLRNTGYGLLPWTLFTIVWLFVAILFFRESRDMYYTQWGFPPFVRGLIWAIFIVWACILWVYGIRHAHGIPGNRAAATVLILIGVYFLAMYAVTYGNIFLSGSGP